MSPNTVARIAKVGKEVKKTLEAKSAIANLSKADVEKLKLIEKYSPKQLEDLFKSINSNRTSEINELIGEKNYLKL